MKVIKNQSYANTIFIGELGLDGKINKINGILAMCMEAIKYGIKKVILPKDNVQEAAFIKNIEIVPVQNLIELVEYLNGQRKISNIQVNIESMINQKQNYEYKFEQIYGQENVKRALEISAAGFHNCIITGSPGSRKNTISKKHTINITRFNI